jgi:hypothetical protein
LGTERRIPIVGCGTYGNHWQSEEHLQDSVSLYTCASMFDYKSATDAVSTEHRIRINELSQVRLPPVLEVLTALIKLHIGTPEDVRLITDP